MTIEKEPEVWMRAICKQCGAAGPKAKTSEEAMSKFSVRFGLAQDIVRALRQIHELDPMVLEDMTSIRFACSQAMADDEHLVVSGPEENGPPDVGVIGWLNGIVGRLCGGLRVARVLDDDASIKSFTLVQVEQGGEVTALPPHPEVS